MFLFNCRNWLGMTMQKCVQFENCKMLVYGKNMLRAGKNSSFYYQHIFLLNGIIIIN